MGLIKPFVLGFVDRRRIACHVGLRTSGGTQGVGRATTNAVVAASVAVIAVDFFVTQAADRVDVLMATQQVVAFADSSTKRWPTAAPVIVFDNVSLAFDDKVILRERQLHAAERAHEDHPRRERRREVDDPAR